MESFDELLAGYLEGDLSPDQRARLKELLEKDAALRAQFLQELQLHEAMKVVSREGEGEGGSEFAENVVAGWKAGSRKTARPVYRAPSRAWRPLLAAAAVLACAAGLYLLLPAKVETSPPMTQATPQPDPELRARQAREEAERELEIRKERERLAREREEKETPAPPAPRPQSTPEAPVARPVPAPKPPDEPKPVPPPPPAAETRVAAAKLVHLRGEVELAGRPAAPGQVILSGDALRTAGPRGTAVFEFTDGSQVELSGAASARVEVGSAGKRVAVEQGVVTADVSKQPPEQQMVFSTPHAEARVLGTSLLVSVDAAGTLLEVDEGRVKFTRTRDGLAIDVSAGHYAIAAVGVELSARPFPQDGRRKPNLKVDAVRVDGAIKRGAAFLRAEHPRSAFAGIDKPQCADELVLWTLIHAGANESDPDFRKLLKEMVEGELQFTYRVALQAMILEQVDRVKYQPRIQQCAQFLVDNQLKSGQWTYGETSPFVAEVKPAKDVATGSRAKRPDPSLPIYVRTKPRVLRKVPVTQKRLLERGGDNSNTQYAALGLRACHDAGILLPREVLALAEKWWRGPQYKDREKNRDAGRGWAYGYDLLDWWGSMTVGAVGSLVIYDYIRGEDWTKDPGVAEGLAWMAANFTVAANPGAPALHAATHYYYLYGLERMGVLFGTEFVGKHEWYFEGAKHLLDAQKPDGSWKGGENLIYDTCFAILFLRRATAPLIDVASVDRFKKR